VSPAGRPQMRRRPTRGQPGHGWAPVLAGAAVALALLPGRVFAQHLDLDVSRIVSWTAEMARAANIPALAVVVTDADETRGIATAGVSGTDRALNAGSRFYIGSVTRTMTAMGVMRLVDKGSAELDVPVTRYLPGLHFSDPERGGRVTVEHLLRHSSGLPTIWAFNRRVQRTGRLDHVPFFAAPGGEVRHSSLNYQILGMLIERVSGLPYDEFMEREIFAPAGMERTTARRAEADDMVRGHTYFFGFPVGRSEPDYAESMIPAGYVITTPEDMAAFMRFYLNGGTVRAKSSPGAVLTEAPTLSHSGMTSGFYSSVAIFPEEGFGVAVLAARNAGPFRPAPDDVLDGLVRIVRGEAPEPYIPWERIIRLGILVLILAGLWRTGRLLREWRGLGRPRSVGHTTPIIARLVLELTLSVGIPLWIILGLARLPIQAFLEFYPDFGIALLLVPALAIPSAVLRTLVKSERWRREGFGGVSGTPAEGVETV